MRFYKFLKIMNCYFGQESSQYEFMYLLFSMIICEPFSEEEMSKDENDDYYLFSNLCGKSLAKKVYNGQRVLPKALARFVHSHYDSSCLIDKIEDMSDEVKENLCADFLAEGVSCNLDNVADAVSNLFKQFIAAAIEDKDTIDTYIKAEGEASIQSTEATNLDILLLEETSNQCPICGRQLLCRNKGNVMKKYKPVQIFPESLDREQYLAFNKFFSINGQYDSMENRITMCIGCALDYESQVSLTKFKKLLKIKETLSKQRELQRRLETIDIEDNISDVISALINMPSNNLQVNLGLQALKVEQKIDKKYSILTNTISNDVICYYKYIEELFRIADANQSNTFERIAGEVKLAYEKLEGNGISQDVIYNELVEWMLRKLDFEYRHRQAVGVVISFFVQNCEVFHEVSQ